MMRCFSGNAERAASSATERHSQEGILFSSTRLRAAGTPALRKYFWARISVATWLHEAGTSMFSRRKTIEPSGFLISLVARRKSSSAYASWPALVYLRSTCMSSLVFLSFHCRGRTKIHPRSLVQPVFDDTNFPVQEIDSWISRRFFWFFTLGKHRTTCPASNPTSLPSKLLHAPSFVNS